MQKSRSRTYNEPHCIHSPVKKLITKNEIQTQTNTSLGNSIGIEKQPATVIESHLDHKTNYAAAVEPTMKSTPEQKGSELTFQEKLAQEIPMLKLPGQYQTWKKPDLVAKNFSNFTASSTQLNKVLAPPANNFIPSNNKIGRAHV